MGNVIPIHSQRIFTREEADLILPAVRRITVHAAKIADEIQNQLKFTPQDEPFSKRLRLELDAVVKNWALKIARLGLTPRGIWLVDFDAGNGWFSWRLGDEALSYFHPFSAPKDTSSQIHDQKLPT